MTASALIAAASKPPGDKVALIETVGDADRPLSRTSA
jgi:hypothetical protein